MMQDRENAPHNEGEHPPGKEGQAGEIFAFQEVVYPPPPEMNRGLQYFIGIAIGAIPLVAALLTLGKLRIGLDVSLFGQIAIYGYITVLVASIVCLCISRVRFVGYGLLTMVLISPVIYYFSCVAVINACGFRNMNC